ncbi:MAG: fatty acid desaturase [Pseudomonadota bacterium]
MAVISAWLACHVLAIYVIDWSALPFIAPVPMILLQAWLCVGLFIIAHDCMHGSLAPHRPVVNRSFGRLTLFLYAAFSYDRLLPDHHNHHKNPGTEDDPDYHPEDATAFWPWFLHFMRHYYGWREFATMTAVLGAYYVLFSPSLPLVLVFFAIPAILSALQLFTFGTYLPHRDEDHEFADHHNSRTNDFPWLLSLITCFHFGYHHEHHLSPWTPWWRLPRLRAERRTVEQTVPAE